MKKVYGIDLGTTYSCISMVDEHNKPVVISNAGGERITPSVVFFEEDGIGGTNIDVGSSAKSFAQMYPKNVVSFVKRQMGTDYTFELNTSSYRAETISSLILKKLVKDAEIVTGDKVEDVVITVPAYFGVNEREATKIAGEIAGLNVVGIINEPTAAALAYGISKDREKRILVYDLGGGTFDVTLINVLPESIEVIASDGDHTLGGKDWDDMIVEYLIQQFGEQTGNVEDIRENPETAQVLQREAENAKRLLTSRLKAPISFMHNIDRVRVELTREKFEELTEPLLERTIDLTNLMLEDASLKGEGFNEFDEIILVGGSTRMLQIRERIVKEYGKEPIMFDPDEAVAKGAALYGQRKSIQDWVEKEIEQLIPNDTDYTAEKGPVTTAEQIGKLTPEEKLKVFETAATVFKLAPASIEKIANQTIKNVTSKSFGVVVMIDEDGKVKEKVVNILKKNEALPCECTQEFGTFYNNQENAKLLVMENAMLDDQLELEDAMPIGEAILELPPGLPEGAPIQVTYLLQEDGCLIVTGIELSSNNTINVTIQTNSVISEDEIEKTKLTVKDFNFS